MKILFDCASFYWKSCKDFGTKPRCVEFVEDIFHKLGSVYRAKHQVYYSTMHDRFIHSCDFIPDVLFTWNDYDVEIRKRISYFRQRGCRVIYAEKAWLPSDAEHFYFDLQGINYYSTLTNWQYNKTLGVTEKRELDAYLDRWRAAGEASPEEYILLPLQVEFDTQISLHSPFKNMQDFIDYASGCTEKMIYVKPHPAGKLDPAALSYPKNCKLIYGDIHNLIRSCSLVMTINSTVGIEALAYYKPVVVLGNAFYANPLFTTPIKWACRAARSPEYKRGDVNEALKEHRKRTAGALRVEHKTGTNAVDAFLHYLIFKRQWNLEDLQNEKLVWNLLNGRVAK